MLKFCEYVSNQIIPMTQMTKPLCSKMYFTTDMQATEKEYT